MAAMRHTPENEAMVGPFAQCVRHDNATPLTYRGTNTWILANPREDNCVLVDPGPAGDAAVRAAREACRHRGLAVRAIVLTHDHPDHAGCAEAAAAAFDAPVLGWRAGTLPCGPFEVPGVGLSLEIVPLPGHSSDSVGIYVAEGDLMVTGDVLFAQSSTMVCWPDGRLADYLESLDRLHRFAEERGVTRLCTAHGPVIENVSERIEAARAHRARRLNQVVSAVRSGIPAQAEAVVEAIYNDVPDNLHDGAVRSVNAQLRYAFDAGMLQGH